MNMKKLMAVVLAVVLAISAMAVNVFAAEGEVVKIPLRPSNAIGTNNSRTYEYKFEFPIYGMYSYLSQDSYLELNLPKNFNADNMKTVWSIETNLGNKVLITGQYWDTRFLGHDGSGNNGTLASQSEEYETIYVNFGAFDRPYVNDQNYATIRQGSFGEITTITLTATVTINNYPGWDNSWSTGALQGNNNMYVQLCTAGKDGVKNYNHTDDEVVTGSNLFASNMSISKTDKNVSSVYGYYDFVSDIEGLNAKPNDNGWDAAAMTKTLDTAIKDANGEDKTVLKNVDLVWDMTLQNRAYIINAESARVVVKLYNATWDKPTAKGFTNGLAVYSLYLADTPMSSTTIGQQWWQNGAAYNRVASRVAFQNVNNEKITELSFEISPEKLYNATYGISAGITSTFRIYAETETPISNFWDAYNRNYDHYTNDAYIELTMPAVDDEVTDLPVDDPVESDPGSDTVDAGEEEPGDDTVNVDEPEDTNPPTGIVLAVLPMVVAAAAVVASKRR